MTKNDRKGWFGSFLIHCLLAVVLFLWPVGASKTEAEFVEISLGTLSVVPVRAGPSSSPSSSGLTAVHSPRERTSPVDLPKRTPGAIENDPPLPPVRKSVEDQNYLPRTSRSSETGSVGEKTGYGTLRDEPVSPGSGRGEGGTTTGPLLAGNDGMNAGRSVAFSMQWGGGGNRRLLSGDLPAYPEGVNVETQIKLHAEVMPDGRVRSLRPVQKGNSKLERAAIEKVKSWIFEPLGASFPSRDQSCVITFNFVLR